MGVMGSGVPRPPEDEPPKGRGRPEAPRTPAEAWEAATRAAQAALARGESADTWSESAQAPAAPAARAPRDRVDTIPPDWLATPPPVDLEIEPVTPRPAAPAAAAADASLAQASAAAHGTHAGASVSASGECSFEASTPFGLALLEIDPRTARAMHALDAALLLERCEPLLQALEHWLGRALDWHWSGSPGARTMVVAPAQARWRLEGTAPQTGRTGRGAAARGALVGRLSLPWALLRSLPAPPELWRAWLKWQPARAVLALAWPRVPVGELGQLEPGGVLLLPESMQGRDWRARLRAADEPARHAIGAPLLAAEARATNLVPVIAPHQPEARAAEARLARTPGGSEADGMLPCEVRLALPKAVPAEWVAGWDAGARLDEAGPVASLWSVSGEGYGRSQCLALGRLMPWGDGWALGLEALKPRRRSAAAGTTAGGAPAAAR